MKFFAFLAIFAFVSLVPNVSFAATSKIVSAKITTGASAAQHLSPSTAVINQVLQCSGAVTASTGTATVKLQGSLDNVNWADLATCTLTLGTSVTASSATNVANWYWYRVNVTALTGTNASVDAWVSY